MKKPFTLLAFVMTLCLFLPALAITAQEAETAARAYVPDGAVMTKLELDDGVYEVAFSKEAAVYDVDVDPSTGVVRKVDGEYKQARGSRSRTLTDAEIPAIVAACIPNAEVLAMQETSDDGLYEIEVAFRTPAAYGTLSLNAETGDMLEFEMYVGELPQLSVESEQAAREALEGLKPGAVIHQIMLDEDDGRLCWEGYAQWQDARYEFELDAASGRLAEWKPSYFKK